MAVGTDPADPALDDIRARARELIGAFTGGDPGLSDSLRRMWNSEDPAELSRGTIDKDVFGYWQRVFAAEGGVG